MTVKNFSEAQNFLSSYIPENPKSAFPGGLGIKRTRALLKMLDNPQEKLRIIHVAGTSGKSSTSYLLSLLLSGMGQKTGLFISPHITDVRERIRINNMIISPEEFTAYLNKLIPFVKSLEKTEFGKLTYFEILTCLAFYYFWKTGATYMVMETGVGGLYDGTNVVMNENKICIITKLGMDHMDILGNTLEQIAEQKAGIITPKSKVITLEQAPEAEEILKKIVKHKEAQLFILQKGINYKNIKELPDNTLFSFNFLGTILDKINLGLLGDFQVENCSLSLAALLLLSRRDGFEINKLKIYQTLEKADFFGRLSKYKIKGKNIILDGAHNGQKMDSLISAIKQIYPKKCFHFLIAFKSSKDFTPILKSIIPLAQQITITSFEISTQEWHHKSVDPKTVADTLLKMGFSRFHIIDNHEKALKYLLNSKEQNDIIITGSFYLISALYPALLKQHTLSEPTA